jgi:hypothetical protein
MKTRLTILRFLSSWISTMFVLSGLVLPVHAQHRAIVVSAEQPNVWTLEQAHYLLAQMHRRNLDLKATGLGLLDPNEINGLNFDILRTLLEVGVAYDQGAQFNNSLLKTRKSFDADRAIKLQQRRDELANESLVLNREIARLGREQALAENKEEKDRFAAQIAELTTTREGVDKEVTRLDADIKGAGGPTGEVKGTEPPDLPDSSRLPSSTFDDAFKDVTKKLIERFNEAPKLNATIRLDNFLQMQYEIIAKQLTLLRDEVGPGERLIFLELPQTVNASYDKANNKWAQSWWRVAGYTKPSTWVAESKARIQKLIDETDGDDVTMAMITQRARRAYLDKTTDFVSTAAVGGLQDRSVRSVELIPRQSSLNVNDIKLRARSGVFTAVAKTLFGIGARLNYQRQRETFSQFVQQELYSSGFGKGSTEFGWTFTPMPGTDRVMSGTRTTYAVMIVPTEAEALILQSTGCYFPRSDYQPISFDNTAEGRWTSSESRRCSERKAFAVPIPGGGNNQSNDFWVDGLEYVPAEKGDRVVLSIYGRNFPAQVGMLVDGVPLTQSIGVAQPLIRDDSAAFKEASEELKEAKVGGRIERIDANQLVAVFERPNGKDQTQPVITLTAPGKALILNNRTLYINRQSRTLQNSELMFGKRPAEKASFRIDKLEIFRSGRRMTAFLTGAGFASGQRGFVNGVEYHTVAESSALMRIRFPVLSDEVIRVNIVRTASVGPPVIQEQTIASDPVPNPGRLTVNSVTVVSYDAGSEDEPTTLVVKIEGSGFTDELRSSLGQLAVKSATEAILKLTNPKAAVVVTLTDRATGQTVTTMVTRKPSP